MYRMGEEVVMEVKDTSITVNMDTFMSFHFVSLFRTDICWVDGAQSAYTPVPNNSHNPLHTNKYNLNRNSVQQGGPYTVGYFQKQDYSRDSCQQFIVPFSHF